MRTSARALRSLGALCAGLAVAAGAFGAHTLKNSLDAPMLAAFETAARYQMYHGLGLCLIGVAAEKSSDRRVLIAGWLFIGGMILFSGSLYLMSLTGIRWLGAVTPLGGASLIIGWGLLAWRLWAAEPES